MLRGDFVEQWIEAGGDATLDEFLTQREAAERAAQAESEATIKRAHLNVAASVERIVHTTKSSRIEPQHLKALHLLALHIGVPVVDIVAFWRSAPTGGLNVRLRDGRNVLLPAWAEEYTPKGMVLTGAQP